MSIEMDVGYLNISAGADLSSAANDNTGPLHKAVTVNGTIAATAALFSGFLKSKGKTGEGIRIAYRGVVKAWAGAAISTVGYPVTVTTSGFVIAATAAAVTSLAAGVGTGAQAVGRAFSTAASGDLVSVQMGGLGAFLG